MKVAKTFINLSKTMERQQKVFTKQNRSRLGYKAPGNTDCGGHGLENNKAMTRTEDREQNIQEN